MINVWNILILILAWDSGKVNTSQLLFSFFYFSPSLRSDMYDIQYSSAGKAKDEVGIN